MHNAIDWKARLALISQGARVDLSNFHLAHYRHVDAFLITGKNSGTHWLKCMLSHAMAHEYGLPAPTHTSGREAEDFIGHPRWPQKHAHLPHIGSSHNVPSALLGRPLARRMLRLPPVVVLVRAIPDAMLSHWVKWGDEKGLSLADYVRLPAPGRRDLADVWWYLDFFNRWGRAAHENPGDILIARYEDLKADPGPWLQRIAQHLGVRLSPGAIDAALAASDREFLRQRLDPNYGEEIVPDSARREAAAFSPEDPTHLARIYAEGLQFDFGYGDFGFGPTALRSPAAASALAA